MEQKQAPKRSGGLLSALPKLHKPNRANLFLLIVSFAAAVLLWAFLVPDQKIPIKLEGISADPADTQAESYNLKLLPESEAALAKQKVSVVITGNISAIGGLEADDVEVYVDYEKVKKEPGEQELSLGLRYKKDGENGGKEIKNESGTTVSIDPPTVIVSLDRFDSKTVPVSKTVLHPDLVAADDVTRIDDTKVIVDPATVIVKGPSTKIDRIDHVSLTVSSSGKLTETKTFNDVSDFTLMDSSGREIDNSAGLFSLQKESFSVTIPVYYQRTLPVSGTISEMPDDEEFQNFIYQRIRIRTENGLYTLPGYGDSSGDGTENNLFLALRTDDKAKKEGLEAESFPAFGFPLNELSIDEEHRDQVEVSDYEVLTDISEIYVSLEDTDLTKRLIWIPNSKIKPKTTRAGYQYQLDQPNGQTGVWLIGRPEDVDRIQEDDLKLTADVFNANEGRNNVELSVQLPENAGIVWVSKTDKNKPKVDINVTVPAE
ncbi:MAG: hypothetical protein IKQ91_11140 [Oscillospiraceae bacterium]|nr:hypothetical protein [Oscillospiraceae bacterium]MBR4201799.1 hypothetical protein [Oscillospiraceae bacterium]